MAEDTPEEQPEDLQSYMNNMLGGASGTEEFFASLENPVQEAFVGLHEMYQSMLAGGFNRLDALQITGVYLFQIIAGQEPS